MQNKSEESFLTVWNLQRVFFSGQGLLQKNKEM